MAGALPCQLSWLEQCGRISFAQSIAFLVTHDWRAALSVLIAEAQPCLKAAKEGMAGPLPAMICSTVLQPLSGLMDNCAFDSSSKCGHAACLTVPRQSNVSVRE